MAKTTITTRETDGLGASNKGAPLTNPELDTNFININEALDAIEGGIGAITKDMTGFPNLTETAYSFVAGTRTFTLSLTGASATVYYRGEEKTLSTNKTIVINNTPGGRYIKLNPSTLALEETTVGGFPSILDDLLVAYIYWDGTKAIVFGDERHGSQRDTQWHLSQHLDVGAIWRTGGELTNTFGDDTSVNIAIANIEIADEDLTHNITHSTTPTNPYQQTLNGTAAFPVVYLNGTEYTETTGTASCPWVSGSNRAYYNPITGGVGALTEVASGKYITYWVVATNDSVNPIKLLMGSVQHNNENQAREETYTSYGLPMPEVVPLYKVTLSVDDTYSNNAAKVVISAVDTLIGRQSSLNNAFSTLTASVDTLASVVARDNVTEEAITVGGLTVNGNVVVTGTVDGRDLSIDGAKLDNIENNATADQTKEDIDALGIDAATVNGLSVETAVPANAVFTDTITTDTNTTYSIKASSQTGGAGLDLDAGGSGSGTDTVVFLGGGTTTVTQTDANTITISSEGGVTTGKAIAMAIVFG